MQKLAYVVYQKLNFDFNIGEPLKATQFSFISSFDHDWIKLYQALEKSRGAKDLTNFIYLHQRKWEDLLPKQETLKTWGKGCNVQFSGASLENLKSFHANKQIVGVWIDKKVTHDEGPELWN